MVGSTRLALVLSPSRNPRGLVERGMGAIHERHRLPLAIPGRAQVAPHFGRGQGAGIA